jgi:hypothetical protein
MGFFIGIVIAVAVGIFLVPYLGWIALVIGGLFALAVLFLLGAAGVQLFQKLWENPRKALFESEFVGMFFAIISFLLLCVVVTLGWSLLGHLLYWVNIIETPSILGMWEVEVPYPNDGLMLRLQFIAGHMALIAVPLLIILGFQKIGDPEHESLKRPWSWDEDD